MLVCMQDKITKEEKMLFGLFILIGIISLILGLCFRNKVAMVGSGAFILVAIIIPVGIYSSNIGMIAKLEAFYKASATNFQLSRDDTASYLSEDKIQSNITLIPITGSIERLGVGANIAARITEYRNAVNDYNTAYAQYKAYKNSALYGIVYPSIPSQMRMLVINPVNNGSPNNYNGQTNITPTTPDTSVVSQPTVNQPNTMTKEETEKAIQDAINNALKSQGK